MSILTDVEGAWTWVEANFVQIVEAMWNDAKQQLLADATKTVTAAGVALQNLTPGLTNKQMTTQLLAAAETSLAGDLANLIWSEITTVVGVVATDLAPNTTPGNAGTLPGGTQTGG